MNEARQIFKNTVALSISDLAGRAGNIFLAFFIARILHAGGLGIYSAAMAYYGVIALAGAMGATSYLVREIANDRSRTNRYVTHLSVLGAVVSTTIMGLFLIALPYLGYSAELTSGMYVIILAVIPGTLESVQRAVFIAHQRVEFVTYTTLASTIVNVSISVYLLTHGYGVISLLLAFVIQQYLAVVCYFYFINRFITVLRWKFEFSFAVTLMREIKTFAALSILAGLFARPEVIILSVIRDEVEVGFYSAALKVVSLWHFLPQIFMTNVFPVLSRSYHWSSQKSQIIQDRSMKYLLVISLPLAAGITVLSEPIINLLYGPGFESSVVPLQILAWTLPLSALISLLWRVLAARNQQDLDLRARIITIFTRMGGAYLLILWWSSVGGAISTIASLLLSTILLARYVGQDGTKLHLSRLSWRSAVAAGGMGVMTWTFSHKMQLWALVPLAAFVYLALVVLLKVFSADDFTLFRKIWQPGIAERS